MTDLRLAPAASLGAPLLGGFLIGGTTSALLFLTGRITGLSGILEDAVILRGGEIKLWTAVYASGLVASGYLIRLFYPNLFGIPSHMSLKPGVLIFAGLLTGFGTRLGCGCTSGHGISGLPRFSVRSLAAVSTFMLTGSIAASITRHPALVSIFYSERSQPFFHTSWSSHWLPTLASVLFILGATSIQKRPASYLPRWSVKYLLDLLASGVSALIFGAALGTGGMLQQAKVLGFLDFAGVNGWDYSLMGVMGGGVTFNVATFYAMRALRVGAYLYPEKQLSTIIKYGMDPANLKIDRSLILGSALFGLGWGISGFCPGPALVSLGGGLQEASTYVPAVMLGMLAQHLTAKTVQSKSQ